MVEIVEENVFDSNADCIVNTINCDGFMGKGLAYEFALRYPELERVYKEQCQSKMVKVNRLYFYDINGRQIINFPTKNHFKYPSRLEWILNGLDYFVEHYKEWNIKSIAFPLLGASNGGLNPETVIGIIKDKMQCVDIPVYICLNKKPDVLNALMIERFNSCSLSSVSLELGLNAKQTKSLVECQGKLKNFHSIEELDGIGHKAFIKLYRYFSQSPKSEQMTLF